MGVWHLSGMGLYPGAVTVPLTYVYLFLASAAKGVEKARRFFETSGELGQKLAGAPEYIVIFTSREMITGKSEEGEFEDWEERRKYITSNWFNIRAKRTAPETIVEYLSALLRELKNKDFKEPYNDEWIKAIYFIEVDYRDFDDCFLKIGVTLKALKEKEIWANMIGGSNQINMSLLLAGSLLAIPVRYYYIFQSKQHLLNPDVPKPDMKNPEAFLSNLDRWQELPIFQLDIGPLLKELQEKFKDKPSINKGELETILFQMGMTKQYIPRLRGRIVNIEKDRVSKGPLFDRMVEMRNRIEREAAEVNDSSSWARWANEKGILKTYPGV